MITVGSNQPRIDAASGAVEHATFDALPGARERDRERPATARALAQERRRIAADIHDLIMQDLALALSTARALADDATDASLADTVVAAGERALAGARQVLDALANERELAIEAVEESTRLAARRVPLSFDADGVPADVRPDQQTLHALVHVAREAVTNATKHADPLDIDVALDYDEVWRLRVSDSGRGFDASDSREGFGLQSMRRQAYALGGSLQVSSAPGGGTTVEAILP